MMKFELGNGHSITVEKANRGIEDDYKVTFFEDGRKLTEYYATKDCVEWEYDVTIQDEETETTPTSEQMDEISKDVKNVIENVANGIMNSLYQIARTLMPVFSAICKMYKTEENPEDIRPPPKMIDFNRIKINLERRKLP